MLTAFDHVNIRTTNLAALSAWYVDVLGLVPGPRPNFRFPGAWLYLGDRAVVHLVACERQPQAGGDVTLEHFAFRARDMDSFLALLTAKGVAHSIDPVPGIDVTQINLHDPDGNHIHVDFDTSTPTPADHP